MQASTTPRNKQITNKPPLKQFEDSSRPFVAEESSATARRHARNESAAINDKIVD